ncbi:hypothetical protein [Fibrella arboris]|uniref:hypothetical protein n=1 Tax=Fibrella arboris TaxID=3242486 RepID=UPI0035228F84
MGVYNPATTWVGIGNKSGGIVMVAGIESVTGRLWNSDTGQGVNFDYTSARLGLGLGGTVASAVIVAAFNCPTPADISTINTSDWGVGLAMGGNLARLLRNVPRYGAMFRLARILSGTLTRAARVNLEDLRSLGSVLYTNLDIHTSGEEPKMITIDVPYISASVELSASYSLSTGGINVYP